MKLSDRKFKTIKGKGKSFGQVAVQTEELCRSWMMASKLDEKTLAMKLDEKNFYINSHDTKGFAYISLEVDDKPIAAPFVWHGMLGISKVDFYTDVLLLMFHLLSFMNNEENKKIIEKKLQELNLLIPKLRQ